jgi:hypothetical protein
VHPGAEQKMVSKTAATTKSNGGVKQESKRVYFKQTDFPLTTLQEAQKIAAALINDFGGKEGSPPDIALAAKISPTSSSWSTITGSSISYGLSDGGINAAVIKLTELGRKLVAPESEGEDISARREAILKPRICREFFEKYKRAKFPSDPIAENVLRSLGIPPDRLKSAVDIVRERKICRNHSGHSDWPVRQLRFAWNSRTRHFSTTIPTRNSSPFERDR